MSATPSPYDAGRHVGQQDQRITDAEDRLDRINGSIRDFVNVIHRLTLELQLLRSDFAAATATVVATATALEKAAVTARQVTEDKAHAADTRWSPWARTIAVIAVIAAIVVPVLTLTLRS